MPKYNECPPMPDVTWYLIAAPPPGRVVFSTLVSENTSTSAAAVDRQQCSLDFLNMFNSEYMDLKFELANTSLNFG